MTHRVHRYRAALALISLVVGIGACRQAAPPAASADSAFASLRDRYFVRQLELNPVTSTYLGGDGYSAELKPVNGRLRDYTPAALVAELGFYRDTLQALRAIDQAKLSEAPRIDYQLMDAQLAFLIREIADRRYHERAIDTYVAEPFRGVDWQIQQMQDLGGGHLGTEEEWNLVVARVSAIPRYLESARANLLAGWESRNLPDRRMVQRDGIDGSRANAEYFRTTLQKSASEDIGDRPFGPALLSRLKEAGAAAAKMWEAFAKFLQDTYDLEDSIDRFAAGAEEYEWRVHTVLRDPRSAAALYDFGAEQVALYTDRIVEVARNVAREANLRLPFGTDAEKAAGVRAVMAYLSKDSPANDDELFRWYREAGERGVAYGREHGLFEIPGRYRLDVVPTPPVLQSTIDAAYYPAPPFKHSGVGRFYLTPTGNNPAALKLNNRASVADTAIHEGFPGHDWHFKFMSEHAAEISNIRWLTPGAVEDSSSMWSDSMAAEGWALYSEEIMAEPAPGHPYGFYSAGEFLYELQGQLLRAVRIRVDVGLHTGRMSFDQATDYFTEHVSFYPQACARPQSDRTARAICDQAVRAIYRYSKWPTQAITYNLGKNAIVSLSEAYRAKLGSRYSAKAFHEKLMKMGTIPAGYFRESFLAGARLNE